MNLSCKYCFPKRSNPPGVMELSQARLQEISLSHPSAAVYTQLYIENECFLAVSCLWGKLDKTATFFISVRRNKRKEVVTDKRTIKK